MQHARTLQLAENRQVVSKAECLLRCDGRPLRHPIGRLWAFAGNRRGISCQDAHNLVCPGHAHESEGLLPAVRIPRRLWRVRSPEARRGFSCSIGPRRRGCIGRVCKGADGCRALSSYWDGPSLDTRLHVSRVTDEAWIRWQGGTSDKVRPALYSAKHIPKRGAISPTLAYTVCCTTLPSP